MALTAQRLAAVVSPLTSPPCRMIAPAPRKPTPAMIWAAILVGRVELETVPFERRPHERRGALGRAAGKKRRAEAEQDVRPEPGVVVAYLPLETEGAAQQGRQKET